MPHTHDRPAENKAQAVLLLLLTTLIFACGDATSKALVSTWPPPQVLFVRCVVVAAITVPYVWFRLGSAAFRTDHPKLHVSRGLLIMLSSIFFVSGLSYLPLADNSAITFISPLLITVLSVFFLGEKVGIRRWSATAVGFIGMLLIIRPGTGGFQFAAIFPLASALAWASAAVVTRSVSAYDRAETTLVWTSLVMLAGACLILPFYYVQPTVREVMVGIGVGLFAVVGHSIFVFAIERANASFLAPFTYIQLVWATALGFFVFGTLPDRWIAGGSALIVASGIYTAHRERVRAKEKSIAR